jgi:hypothetical protein
VKALSRNFLSDLLTEMCMQWFRLRCCAKDAWLNWNLLGLNRSIALAQPALAVFPLLAVCEPVKATIPSAKRLRARCFQGALLMA